MKGNNVKQIIYATSNQMKLLTARNVLLPLGIEVISRKIDCPEIQADSIEEVAKYSSTYASNFLKCTVLKNDTGLIIPALNNFPGPYTKFVEATITEDGILKLMTSLKDRQAYFLEVFALSYYNGVTKVFISKTEGYIAEQKSGEFGWGYDRIFIPKNHSKTLACYEDEARSKIWSSQALIELADYISHETN